MTEPYKGSGTPRGRSVTHDDMKNCSEDGILAVVGDRSDAVTPSYAPTFIEDFYA